VSRRSDSNLVFLALLEAIRVRTSHKARSQSILLMMRELRGGAHNSRPRGILCKLKALVQGGCSEVSWPIGCGLGRREVGRLVHG
jgi:hypothetical protein